MAIGDDFSIDYTNKIIYHSNGTTVYTVNQLYSHIMDTFDELDQMDDTVPMSAQTPTAYTMINGWFLDIGTYRQTHKYLEGGAIETSGYSSVIQVIQLVTGWTNAVTTDIGKQVKDDGSSVGALLSYDNTNGKWWCRSSSTVADTSVMTIDTGTGAGTGSGASVTGEDLYANVYSLGTVETVPGPQIYAFQNGIALSEWSSLTNWDRGHIDVLIQVKEAGTEIDGAVITVFARQYGDAYDHYEIDLTAGGRNAVPLATSDDINNTKGSYYILYDGESNGPFTVGEIITDQTSAATAEVVAVTDWGTEGLLTLGGIKNTFGDNNKISGGTSNAAASINGTIGDTYVAYDAETQGFTTLGQIVYGNTNYGRRLLRGIQDDGAAGKIVLQVDSTASGSAKAKYYINYANDEVISGATDGDVTVNGVSTTVVGGYGDVTIAFANGTATYSNGNGTTATEFERIQWSSSGNAILLGDTGSALTLGNCTYSGVNTKWFVGDLTGVSGQFSQDLQLAHTKTQNFEQQSSYEYDVHVECGTIYNAGRSLNDVYEYTKFRTGEDNVDALRPVSGTTMYCLSGEEYIQAFDGYSIVKTAPFGTFAGGKMFGARGVWVEGMAAADNQSFQLIDSNGNTRTPPVSITIKVDSTVSGDRVCVFKLSGSSDVDKWMYYASGTQASGNNDFWVSGTLETDTPSTGYIRLVSGNTEQRIAYTSWVSSACFVLSTALNTGYTRAGDDTAYVPYIDGTAIATSIEKSVIYASDRNVLTRVRKKGIIPFEVAGSVTSAGLTVAAIRTSDSIVN